MQRGSRNSIVTKRKEKKKILVVTCIEVVPVSIHLHAIAVHSARRVTCTHQRPLHCCLVPPERSNPITVTTAVWPPQSRPRARSTCAMHNQNTPGFPAHRHNKAPVGSSCTGTNSTAARTLQRVHAAPTHQPGGGGGLQASGGDLEVSSGWLGSAGGTWRELLQFPPERARRMILPLMMSRPKPSWCAKA